MQERKERLILLLGSNLGDRLANIRLGVCLIKRIKGLDVIGITPVYETSPVGVEAHPDYLNCGILATTELEPLELLDRLEEIERRLGRRNKGLMLPRTMDIDILIWGERRINLPRLKIPHPAIEERPFARQIINLLLNRGYPGGIPTRTNISGLNDPVLREFSKIPI